MNARTLGLSFTLATLGLVAAAPSAQAFSVSGHINGEDDFSALGKDISWAAESRIGRVGDYEVDIHNSDFSDVTHQNFDQWVSGQEYNFSLDFDGSTLTYTVNGNVTVTKGVSASDFSDIFIRTTARKDGSSALVKNLFLTDDSGSAAIAETSAYTCTGSCPWGSAQYLQITDVSGAFTLTGTSVFTWDAANKPKNSELAYQIKLVEGGGSKSVPEPASVLALGLVAGCATQLKRRNQD